MPATSCCLRVTPTEWISSRLFIQILKLFLLPLTSQQKRLWYFMDSSEGKIPSQSLCNLNIPHFSFSLRLQALCNPWYLLPSESRSVSVNSLYFIQYCQQTVIWVYKCVTGDIFQVLTQLAARNWINEAKTSKSASLQQRVKARHLWVWNS